MKILIPEDIAVEAKEWLQERGYELEVGCGTAPEDLKAAIADADAVLARLAVMSREVLEASPRLKVVAKHGVGVDNIDLVAASERGVWVTNAPFSNAGAVAEWTIGAIFALAKNFIQCDDEMRRGNFDFRRQQLIHDVAGKTLGIVGLGKIGSKVAHKAAALEMQVMGFDANANAASLPPELTVLSDWDTFWQTCDFLTLHVPLTEQTRGFVGAREFEMMKLSAFFINAARGELVDEDALVQALQNRQIAGAALDVFRQEPPPANHPLFTMPNVLLTPHNSALTHQATRRMALDAAQGIHEVLSGRKPTWPVNEPQIQS